MKMLLRSMLFVPAHNEKFIQKAINCDADALIFDFEDAVPKENKSLARKTLARFLNEDFFAKKRCFVRVNENNSDDLMEDLNILKYSDISGVVTPKIDSKEDIFYFESLIEKKEKEFHRQNKSIKLLPLIETAASIMNIQEIAASSERLVALLFGGEDYLDSIWGDHLNSTESFYVPRSMVVLAARMNGLIPIDTPYLDLKNESGYKEEEKKSYAMGFGGDLLVTPMQIPWANESFSPCDEEVEHAREVMKVIQTAKENGGSISKVNGKMVGPPMRKRAEKVMEIYNLILEKENKDE